MRLYLKDLFSALWAWVRVWHQPVEKLERQRRFVNDALNDDRKKQLPYKILMAAYRKRLTTQTPNP